MKEHFYFSKSFLKIMFVKMLIQTKEIEELYRKYNNRNFMFSKKTTKIL